MKTCLFSAKGTAVEQLRHKITLVLGLSTPAYIYISHATVPLKLGLDWHVLYLRNTSEAQREDPRNVTQETFLAIIVYTQKAPWIAQGGNDFNKIIYFELSQLSGRCLSFHTSSFLPNLSDEAAELKVCCHFRIKRHTSTCYHVSDPKQASGDCMWQISYPTQESFPVTLRTSSSLLISRLDRTQRFSQIKPTPCLLRPYTFLTKCMQIANDMTRKHR